MEESGSKPRMRLWLFALVAVGYTLTSNFDTYLDAYDLPRNVWDALSVLSTLASFVAGLVFFITFVPLVIWWVVTLIRRKRPGRSIIWLLFIGALFIVDSALVRYVLLDFSRDRSMARAQPLIAAIEQYRIDLGSFPLELDSLVPKYTEQLPRPGSPGRDSFTYENLDSTYEVGFNQWMHGRKYRSTVYNPTDECVLPEYADTDAYETGTENWKYYYY